MSRVLASGSMGSLRHGLAPAVWRVYGTERTIDRINAVEDADGRATVALFLAAHALEIGLEADARALFEVFDSALPDVDPEGHDDYCGCRLQAPHGPDVLAIGLQFTCRCCGKYLSSSVLTIREIGR